MTDNATLDVVLLVAVCGLVYFVPLMIATRREHPHTAPIAVVNLLLGWTVVGWVVALAWAVAGQTGRKPRTRRVAPRRVYEVD